METFGVSERFACRILGQHRSTQRKIAKMPEDDAVLICVKLMHWLFRRPDDLDRLKNC
jgi:hypothetical protein